MLGLCWKPATIQGMQKVASSMPSNPEQLLGAILVRRDIFQRFESTMQDTCLDANNLLEYLFSLYNSTATPAERENFQPNQNIRPLPFNAARRDANQGKKASSVAHPTNIRQITPKGHHIQNIGVGGQVHQGIPEVHINDGHARKRAKMEHPNITNNNVGHHHNNPQHQQQGFPNLLRPFDPNPVFSGSNNIKMEMGPGPEGESRLTQSSSPLPPFSQIRRQQGRPFSPGSAQNIGPGTPTDGQGPKYGLDGSLDQSNISTTDTSMDQSDNNKSQSTPLKDNNSGLPRRKRPKRHQCFCGALFTRADNLKRHIRKCHEEKLEKLTATNPTGEGEQQTQPTNATFEEFQQLYPAAGQDLQQQQQQQQPQQLTQEQDLHQQQQVQQQQVQQVQEEHQLNDVSELAAMNKATPTAGLKWSCFCGESFEDHRQLVEHSRIHEANQ